MRVKERIDNFKKLNQHTNIFRALPMGKTGTGEIVINGVSTLCLDGLGNS